MGGYFSRWWFGTEEDYTPIKDVHVHDEVGIPHESHLQKDLNELHLQVNPGNELEMVGNLPAPVEHPALSAPLPQTGLAGTQFPMTDPVQAFLQSHPCESDLRSEICSKVGDKWRAVSTYLNIPTAKVDNFLESHKHNVEEAFFRILCHWRWHTGKRATWGALLTALRKAGLNALANKLLEQGSSATCPLPVVGTELQSQATLLREQAYNEYSHFRLGEGPKANMQYVQLAVLERLPSSNPDDVRDKMEAIQRFKDCCPKIADENAMRITPHDLLKKGDERIRVVYGQAGAGKTTLLKHMCKALACDEAGSDFDLVLYFPLRDRSVSSAGDLQSLLSYYLQDAYEGQAAVSSMTKVLKGGKGKGILMVFDGADEVKDLLKPSSESVIQSLLQGHILPEAHIIISSRPGACPSIQDYVATFYEVQGFNHTAVTSYVKAFYESNSHTADRMLSQLATRPDLLAGAYIPMNCFILCSIFEHDSSFPATMTACYQAFVCQIIYQDCRKIGRDLYMDPLLRYSHLPEDIRYLLASLGTLSFRGLRQVPPQFIFDEYSLRSTIQEELLPSDAPIDEHLFKGLLHMHASRRGFESLHSFSFPHGTQQEFFAALHLSQLEEGKQAQFWKENLFNATYSVVLRFFAGLTGLRNPQVAMHICCTPTAVGEIGCTSHWMGKCSRDNPTLLLLFHTLYESQNINLTKEVMQRITVSLEFCLTLSAFDMMAVAHCLRQCSHLRLLKLTPYLSTLLSAECLVHLKAVLQCNPQCQLDFAGRLELHCDNFTADDAQTLSQVAVSLETLLLTLSHTSSTALSIVCSLPGVRELYITVRSDVEDDSGWQQVETSLIENVHLKELHLDGCDAFLCIMGKALSRNTSLHKLRLNRKEPLHEHVAGALGTCVAAMAQLNELDICQLPLLILKALAEREQPLQRLHVWSPSGVNWDSLSMDQWMEAKEAAASAKVTKLILVFDAESRQRARAIQAITDGLATNTFVRDKLLM